MFARQVLLNYAKTSVRFLALSGAKRFNLHLILEKLAEREVMTRSESKVLTTALALRDNY